MPLVAKATRSMPAGIILCIMAVGTYGRYHDRRHLALNQASLPILFPAQMTKIFAVEITGGIFEAPFPMETLDCVLEHSGNFPAYVHVEIVKNGFYCVYNLYFGLCRYQGLVVNTGREASVDIIATNMADSSPTSEDHYSPLGL